MAQNKLNLKRILEFIGLTEANDEEQNVSRVSRVNNTAYEEERFTPAKKTPASSFGAKTAAETHARPAPASRVRRDEGAARRQPGRARNAGRDMTAPRPEQKRDVPAGTGTMVYYMHALNECSNVIRDLLSGYSILLNLEETDSAQMQRIVDTLAGASFALGAVIRKVSEKTYIIAPRNVNVMTSDRYERRY